MLAVIENIAAAAAAKPQKAKALLRAVVDSVLMRPTPEGYAARILLKRNSLATVEGDEADVYQTGCGGRILRTPYTVRLALSAILSPVRGVSDPERLVGAVSPPRALCGAGASDSRAMMPCVRE